MFAQDKEFAVCLQDYGSIKKYARVPTINELYAEVEQWLEQNGGQFEPLPSDFAPPKTDEQLLAEAKQTYEDGIKSLIGDIPYTEIASWDKQESEARALLADSNAKTPFLGVLVLSRNLGETREQLATKVVANSDAYEQGAAQLLGEYQAKVKQITGDA